MLGAVFCFSLRVCGSCDGAHGADHWDRHVSVSAYAGVVTPSGPTYYETAIVSVSAYAGVVTQPDCQHADHVFGFSLRVCESCDLNVLNAVRSSLRFSLRVCGSCDSKCPIHASYMKCRFSLRVCGSCDRTGSSRVHGENVSVSAYAGVVTCRSRDLAPVRRFQSPRMREL